MEFLIFWLKWHFYWRPFCFYLFFFHLTIHFSHHNHHEIWRWCCSTHENKFVFFNFIYRCINWHRINTLFYIYQPTHPLLSTSYNINRFFFFFMFVKTLENYFSDRFSCFFWLFSFFLFYELQYIHATVHN